MFKLLYVLALFVIVFGIWFAPILLLPGTLGLVLFGVITVVGIVCMMVFAHDPY